MNSSGEKTEPSLSSEFLENLNILREIYFFSSLPLDVTKVLAYLCTRERFKPGDHLFSQGDDDGLAFYIISGTTRLTHEDNGERRPVRDLEPDRFIGGLSLMGNMHRLFSLEALTETLCLVLGRDKFSKAMEQFPDQMPKIFNGLVARICQWEDRFLDEINEKCEACRAKIGVSLI